MPLDPRRLLVLRAVHRTGSVHAAASAMHLTPSGVSQHLTRLEAEARLPLLDRTLRGGGRAVRLTPAGLALAERADLVAHALADAQREAERLRDGAQGLVRIGGFAAALTQLVVPALSQLAVSDPALRVQVLEVTAEEGVSLLRAGQLDLLIDDRLSEATAPQSGPFPGLAEDDLCRDALRIVVPAWWAARQDTEELLAGPWVTSPAGHPTRRMLDRLRAHYDVTEGHQHICTESRSMLALVAAGLGAAIVPDLTLAALPTDGVRVHGLPVDIGSRVLSLLGPDPARRSDAIERFRSQLLEIAARGS